MLGWNLIKRLIQTKKTSYAKSPHDLQNKWAKFIMECNYMTVCLMNTSIKIGIILGILFILVSAISIPKMTEQLSTQQLQHHLNSSEVIFIL